MIPVYKQLLPFEKSLCILKLFSNKLFTWLGEPTNVFVAGPEFFSSSLAMLGLLARCRSELKTEENIKIPKQLTN